VNGYYGPAAKFNSEGDYVLSFYAMLEKSPLGLIGCTRCTKRVIS